MPNFTLSEIVTIALIILIVFGPERLPEMARKAGQLVRKTREMVSGLRQDFEGELGDVAQPLRDARREILGMKAEVESSMASLNEDIAKAKAEMEAQVAETENELKKTLAEQDDAAEADGTDSTAGPPESGDDSRKQDAPGPAGGEDSEA